METDQRYRLRWDDYRTQVIDAFETLLDGNDFVDVTLVSGQTKIQAHKMLLSAASPYFRYLLKGNPCQHPIIFLRDIPPDDLQILLQFIYQGEVSVCQDKLESLLRSADSLNIVGLTTNIFQYETQYKGSESATRTKHRNSTKSTTKTQVFVDHERKSYKSQTACQNKVDSMQNDRSGLMLEKQERYSHHSKPCDIDNVPRKEVQGREVKKVGMRESEEYCNVEDDVQEHYDDHDNTNSEQEQQYISPYQGTSANKNQTSQMQLSTDMSNYMKTSYKHKKLGILLEGKSKLAAVDPPHPNWLSSYRLKDYENVYMDVDKNRSAKALKEGENSEKYYFKGEKDLRLVKGNPNFYQKVTESAIEFKSKHKGNSVNLLSKDTASMINKTVNKGEVVSFCDTNEECVDDPDAINVDEMTERSTQIKENIPFNDRKRKREVYFDSFRGREEAVIASHKAARIIEDTKGDTAQEHTEKQSSSEDAIGRVDDDREIEIVPAASTDNTCDVQLDCRICERTFHHQDSFMAHKKYHSGLTVCSICTHPFATIGTLNRHLRSVHKIPMGRHK